MYSIINDYSRLIRMRDGILNSLIHYFIGTLDRIWFIVIIQLNTIFHCVYYNCGVWNEIKRIKLEIKKLNYTSEYHIKFVLRAAQKWDDTIYLQRVIFNKLPVLFFYCILLMVNNIWWTVKINFYTNTNWQLFVNQKTKKTMKGINIILAVPYK